MSAEQQTEKLAHYIMENFPRDITDGGAGDVAIKIMDRLQEENINLLHSTNHNIPEQLHRQDAVIKRYREAIDYVTSAKLDQYRNEETMLNDFKYVINKTLERESE